MRCTAILLQCGKLIGVGLPLPTLGVSSLDLGRFGTPERPLFFLLGCVGLDQKAVIELLG